MRLEWQRPPSLHLLSRSALVLVAGLAACAPAPSTEPIAAATDGQGSQPLDPINSDVLTNRYDNGRTGHVVVPGMTGASVAAGHWGRRGALPVDGAIYAQPLFTRLLPTGNGQTRDVVYVATARNNVYAFDANTLANIWHDDKAAGSAVRLPDPDRLDETLNSACATMSPTWVDPAPTGKRELGIGIQSTPVIDRKAGVLYVSYRTRPGSSPGNLAAGHAEQWVAALRLTDGALVNQRAIPASAFKPFTLEGTRQRASLLLQDGVLYLAFASHCEEKGPGFEYVGRVLAVDAKTLALVGQFDIIDPASGVIGGGIWQASSGLAADPKGDIYFSTGNRQNDKDYTPGPHALVSSIVRLRPIIARGPDDAVAAVGFATPGGSPGPWGWFTPYRTVWQDRIDLDLGASGVLLPPSTNALVSGGKEGILYVLDRDHLGGVDADRWTNADFDRVRFPPDPNHYDCLNADETRNWCNQGPLNLCVMPPDDANHDQRPGSQKIHAAQNFECEVLGTPPRFGNWGQYPHLHGTPAYARFSDGRERMYYWPEKDLLKALERDPTVSNFRFKPIPIGAEVLAPARGMPGGFLTVVTDSLSNGGVVFAAVPQTAEQDAWGALLAYDAVPGPDGFLHQVWSAYESEPFRFAKFVPPTVADGKVFLATFSNAVEVFGPSDGGDQENAMAGIAATLQNASTHRVTAAVVEPSGQIALFGEANDGGWGRLNTLGAPGQYPPGGAVALDVQNGTQLVLLAVDANGTLEVSWLALGADPSGSWGSARLGGGYPPGAKIVTAHQTPAQLDAFLVGNDGLLHQASVLKLGVWQDRAIKGGGAEPQFLHGDCVRGGCVKPAVGFQGPQSEQLDVAAVDTNGVLWVYATSAAAGQGAWGRFDIFNGARFLPPAADLAAARQKTAQIDDQLDLFAVDNNGILEVAWVHDFDVWQRSFLTGSGFIVTAAPAGAHVAVGNQGPNQLDVAVVGSDGTIQLYYAAGLGAWSAFETGTLGIAAPGAPIVLVPQSGDGQQLDALVPRANGIFGIFTIGNGWQGPFRAL